MGTRSVRALPALGVLLAACLVGAPPASAQGFLEGLGRGLGQEVGRGIGEVLRESTRPQPQPPTETGPPPPSRAEPRPVPQPQSSTALSRADVVELQQHLIDLGYLRGSADGIAGPMTRRALEAFQRDRGMPADGQPTLQALRATRAARLSEASPPQPHAPRTAPIATAPQPASAPPAQARPPITAAGAAFEIDVVAGTPRNVSEELRSALGRLAIAAHSSLLDHEAVSVQLARLLMPEEAAPYFATHPQQGQQRPAQTNWNRWRGETEFEQERSRAAFLERIPPRLATLGQSEPITLRLRFAVPLDDYDAASRSFRIDTHQTTFWSLLNTGNLLGRPGTSAMDLPWLQATAAYSGLGAAVAFGLALPQRVEADAATAETIARAARPGSGARRQLTFVVEAVVGPDSALVEWRPSFGIGRDSRPLEPIQAKPRFDARVTALTLHADPEGRGPVVHAFPLATPEPGSPGAPIAALGFGAMPTGGFAEERARNAQTQRTLSMAVLRARPELLEREAVLLYAAHAFSETPERYVSASRGSVVWAGSDQFAREESRDRAQSELPPLLAERAPSFPLTLRVLTRMTVGEYDRDRGGFALAPSAFALPQALQVQRVSARTTADRALPTLLPIPLADAPAVLRSLPRMRMGSQDRPFVLLQTILRLDPPEVTDLGHDQIHVTLHGRVTEQVIFADPHLQRRLADDGALARHRPEAPILAALAAEIPRPAEPVVLDQESADDLRALLRLKAGTPVSRGEAWLWLRALAGSAATPGLPLPQPLSAERLRAFDGDPYPLLDPFMDWNARRLVALPETIVHRYVARLSSPWDETKRFDVIDPALQRGGWRSPPPALRRTVFQTETGGPGTIAVDAALMQRLGPQAQGRVEIETHLRIVGATMEDDIAVVTVAVSSASVRIAGSVVAQIGAAATAAETAPAGTPRLAILDLQLGQSMAAARATLARHLGEGHIVARLYRERSRPHNPQPMPHGVLMERADGSERIALYAAAEDGPVIAVHRMVSLPGPVPQRDVLAQLEQRYGPLDRREGGVTPAEHLGGVGTLAFGWSDGPSRAELAHLPRERADCVARLQTGSPGWWWREAEPQFGRVRGAAGPVIPRTNPESDCGATLRIAFQGPGGTDQVEGIVALLADLRALAAIAPNTDEVPAVGSFGRIASGVPDVIGVRLGMDWEDALAAAQAHLPDAVTIELAPPASIDPARLEPYRNGVVLIRRDRMEAVGLYREPPDAADRVVAVWRRLVLPGGAVDPARVLAGLVEKYGPPDHRVGERVYWGTVGAEPRPCGELVAGALPEGTDASVLAELGLPIRPGQRFLAFQIPAATVLDGLPVPQVFGGVGAPGDAMRDTRLLACTPHVAAQIDSTTWPDRIRIDQWALDEGGYVGLLDAARAALMRPAAGAAGGADGRTGPGSGGPTIRF
jgi:hypothetical protein